MMARHLESRVPEIGDSCEDYSFESSSSISIHSSCSELCTSDESECLESDEELENIRSNCSPSLVLD